MPLAEAAGLDEPRERFPLVAVAALLAVGCSLRLWSPITPGIWLDETASLWVLKAPDLAGVVWRSSYYQVTPPLYFVLSWLATRLIGDPLAASRIVSELASCLVVPAVALLTWSLSRSRAATTVAAALVAVDQITVLLAYQSRAYALGILLVALGWWSARQVIEAPATGRILLFSVLLIAQAATHIVLLPAVGAQLAIVALELLSTGRWRAAWRSLAGGLALSAAGLLPILRLTALTWGRRSAYDWSPREIAPIEIVRFVPLSRIGLIWLIAIAAHAVRGLLPPRLPALGERALVVLCGAVLVPGAFLYAIAQVSPTLAIERYWYGLVAPSLAAGAILLSVRTRPRLLGIALVVALALLPELGHFWGVVAQTGHPGGPRMDWRDPVAVMDRELPKGSLLFFRGGFIEADYFRRDDAEAQSYLAAPLVLSQTHPWGEVVALPSKVTEQPEPWMEEHLERARREGRPVGLLAMGPGSWWGLAELEAWMGRRGFRLSDGKQIVSSTGNTRFDFRVWRAVRP